MPFDLFLKQALFLKHYGSTAQLFIFFLGGGVMPNIPKDIASKPFYNAEQNGCPKFLLGAFGKWMGLRERLLAPLVCSNS